MRLADDDGLIARVREAPLRTVAGERARVLYEVRVGAPDGPPSRVQRQGDGVVDFAQVRVFYPTSFVTPRGTYPGETQWVRERQFDRGTPVEPWRPLPRPRWLQPGAMPFGAPLWLLGALGGTQAVSEIGNETVRAASTTRYRVTVNCAQAKQQSPWPLGFPRTPAETFPAEVWLDAGLRIRRMGCDWQPPSWDRARRFLPRRRPKKTRTAWITTEFWDYGTDAQFPADKPD